MSYKNKETSFKGDAMYSINCTGDAVVGDEVKLERALFNGSYKNPKFAGFEILEGKIIKDSYGVKKGQHTFTLLLINGSKLRIKGRNLYKNGTFRKFWDDETKRYDACEEKHCRGNDSREKRDIERYGYTPTTMDGCVVAYSMRVDIHG